MTSPRVSTRPLSVSARPLALVVLVVATLALVPTSAAAHGTDIWFPQQLPVEFTDSWGDPRGSHGHTGVDLMGRQMQEVYAAVDGTIHAAENEHVHEGSYASSYYLLISGDDGHSYFYVHLNNDTPGRPGGCDGRGGVENAYAPRLVDELAARGTLAGVRVRRGEHIAYVGSSGNAGCGTDHTHFEVWEGHGWGATKVNPYPFVRDAYDAGRTWGPDGAPPAPGPHGRLEGGDRVLTSVATSQQRFDSADTVLIAPADSYAEALVAAPLAATHGAPTLLSWGTDTPDARSLRQEVIDEVRRLGATSAILVGGPDRLPDSTEQQLVERAGLDRSAIRRISAPDRYALSAAVAEEVLAGTGGGVSPLLALGDAGHPTGGWPDALTASVLGASQRVPVVLTQADRLPDAARQVLGRDDLGTVRLIGGSAVISSSVEEEVRGLGRATRRLAGEHRFATALAVAEELVDGGAAITDLHLATGLDYPDALSAGPAVAVAGQTLLLVHGTEPGIRGGVYAWLRDHADGIQRVTAVGGPVAVSDDVLRKAAAYAEWPR